ncbi:MAG: ATP-grasp domain-containing protein [Moorea sp. SIOASIH]|uniref:ATP-grasp domain-containing protein n=1 Tax=Moorena sp. SIOASIH TaxID=2607817 RepID=UPI0013B83557|nr:ATP-grasp domain-containing protein [Moorena sp. SIOASIH]NEO35147.1 ATP-grasp domain-containing protein [Moorena sp. SIOASIH]
MTGKKVLIINLGWEQEPLIEKLITQGHQVIGIHYDDSYNHDLDICHVEIIDLRDVEKILSFAKQIQPDGVISDQCDYSYFATAMIAEVLSLPGANLEVAQIATNKLIQRQKALELGVLQPKFRCCTCLKDVQQFIADIGFPIILKPVDNRGSFGVNRVDCIENLAEAYYDALINSHSRLILAEQFIHGTHITVDGYCFPISGHRSLGLATKGMVGGNRQVAVDIRYPGELPEELYNYALENNNDVVRKLGYSFGMTHAEYMLTSNGDAYLIEIANRGGGCYTSNKIVPAVSGIDITDQLIADSLDIHLDYYQVKQIPDRHSAYLKFFVFKPGKIQKILGINEVIQLPNIEVLRLRMKDGDEVHKTTTDADRHGFFIAKGKTLKESIDTAEHAMSLLSVQYS